MSKITHARHGVGGHSLFLEDLAPLPIRRAVLGIFKPQNFEVYLHAAGPKYEQVDGVLGGL